MCVCVRTYYAKGATLLNKLKKLNKMKLILKSEITNTDILENINANTEAILLLQKNNTDWWIDVLKDGSFEVQDGWTSFQTNNIFEAINYLNEFIVKNS